MILGVDTGFFLALINGHPRAQQIWNECRDGHQFLVVSTLTVNEIFAYFLRRGIVTHAQQWLSLIQSTEGIDLSPVSTEIAALAARYRVGAQLSTVESIILATFLISKCDLMITTDKDFQIVSRPQIIQVEFLP